MQTPNPVSRSHAALPTLQTMYTTPPFQRPSTSAGEAIEPTSNLLRKALHDRRLSPLRPQSTTPRKAKTVVRSTAYMDPWMPSDEDEPARPRLTRSQTSRPARRRRATDLGNARPTMTPSPPPSPSPGVGLKTEQKEVDKLSKENWDLKHRIALQQGHASKLQKDLEKALAELELSKDVRERNAALEKERDRLKLKLSHAEEQNNLLDQELKSLDEEVNTVLDQKDAEIRDRQLAIEEAAAIIQKLEIENRALLEASQPQQIIHVAEERADSDYFSGDHENSPKITPTKHLPVPSTPMMHDSDYFSASPHTSPNLTPRSTRRPLTRANTARHAQDELRRANARVSAAAFDRAIGLKCAASKDSLLLNYLENGTPVRTSSKTLRHRLSRLSSSVVVIPSPPESDKGTTWSGSSRPLRELYRVGELGRQIGSDKLMMPRSLSPSTQASVSELSSATSIDDRSEIFSQGNETRASTPATIRSADTITDETLQKSSNSLPLEMKRRGRSNTNSTTVSSVIPTLQTRTPVNYDMWPRKYPEWPPSASLHNRDVLFHDTDALTVVTSPTSPTRYSEDDSFLGISMPSIAAKVSPPRKSDTSLSTLAHRVESAGGKSELMFADITPTNKVIAQRKTPIGGAALAGVGNLMSRSLHGSLHGVRHFGRQSTGSRT